MEQFETSPPIPRTIRTSQTINELATALSKAQGVMAGAKKDSANPYFNSKYADLASVWEACRKALSDNQLSVVQSPRIVMLGDLTCIEIETCLLHGSGQWMADTLTVPVSKIDAQGVGSAITYARRYALGAFVGVAPEDDDANAAVSAGPKAMPVKAPAKPKKFDDWFDDLVVVADNGWDAIVDAWKKSPQEMRDYVLGTPAVAAQWAKLKEKAKGVKAGVANV